MAVVIGRRSRQSTKGSQERWFSHAKNRILAWSPSRGFENFEIGQKPISNPKSEIANWTRSNLQFRISDLRCRNRPISNSLLMPLRGREWILADEGSYGCPAELT